MTVKKSIIYVFTVLITVSTIFSETISEHSQLRFRRKLFRPLSTHFTYQPEMGISVFSDDRFYINTGLSFTFYEYSLTRISADETGSFLSNSVFCLQAGMHGVSLPTLHLKRGSRFTMETVDSQFGLHVDLSHGDFYYSLRFTHHCSHISEGVFKEAERVSELSAMNYSREFLEFYFAWEKWGFRPYLGIRRGDKFFGATKGTHPYRHFHFGTEYFQRIPRVPFIKPFIGLDLGFKSEADYRPSFEFTFGSQFYFLKVYGKYFSGTDPRGNFHTRYKKAWGWGVGFVF